MKTHLLPIIIFLFSSIYLVGQQSWEPSAEGTLPENHWVADLSIVSEEVIWAVVIEYPVNFPVESDHTCKVMKTTDGGASWEEPIDIAESMGRACLDIHAFDENTAVITSSDLESYNGSGILRTTDGGNNWTEALLGYAGGFWVHFYNDQEGICIFGEDVANTTDGGVTWEVNENPNNPDFLPDEFTAMASSASALEIYGDHLWFGTDEGRLFRSKDRGHNWEVFVPGFENDPYITSVAFVDELNGLCLYNTASSDGDLMARSYDGGASWIPQESEYPVEELIVIPCTNVFMGTSWNDSITVISTDLGETWTLVDDIAPSWAPAFKSPELGWISNGSDYGAEPPLYKWVGETFYGRTYVDQAATGNDDGTSWDNAYVDLQEALALAENGDQIWVAEGTFIPGNTPEATFLIDTELHLYGGFASAECYSYERDLEEHQTILSGDLNGDDVDDDFENNKDDNAQTVVRVISTNDNTTLIDGFTIRNGNSDGGPNLFQQNGGGLHSEGSLTIRNCLFTQNFCVENGGGLYSASGSSSLEVSIKIENSSFEKNVARAGAGARLELNGSDWTSSINGCTFHQNEARPDPWSDGAGLLTVLKGTNGSFVLQSSSFSGNHGAIFGGGAEILAGSPSTSGNVEVFDCIFENNQAANDGGLGIGSLPDAGYFEYHVSNCQFLNNEAEALGGGIDIYSEAPSSIIVEDCLIEGNTAGEIGGGIGIATGTEGFQAVSRNCIIKNNTSPAGAAIGATPDSNNNPENTTLNADVRFENSLITGHTSGTIIELVKTGNIQMINCTIAGNNTDGVKLDANSAITFQNNILFNPEKSEFDSSSEGTITSNGGNLISDDSFVSFISDWDLLNSDPLFVGSGEDCEYLQLTENSPALNRGLEWANAPETDLCGNDRIQENRIDAGAFESPFVNSVREVIAGELGLSPNPANKELTVTLPHVPAGQVEISLYGAQGKWINRQTITSGQVINLDGLPNGMYLIKANFGEKIYTDRFMKQ